MTTIANRVRAIADDLRTAVLSTTPWERELLRNRDKLLTIAAELEAALAADAVQPLGDLPEAAVQKIAELQARQGVVLEAVRTEIEAIRDFLRVRFL